MVLEDDGRFGFLLKPIRDLTKNWDVDIASHLEEYLEELENVAITFDGGRTMDFAEAALLIQGSTCVYSRKVEYLYVLVHEVLDLIVNKKRNKSENGKNNKDGADPDVTFGDEDVQLLPLDDVKETEIVMKENEKGVGTIPRRPMSLVPFGNEIGNDQLLTNNGDVFGSRKDFRLNTSQINRDSCLLLEASFQLLSELRNKSEEKLSHGEPLTNDKFSDIQMAEDSKETNLHNFDDDDGGGGDDDAAENNNFGDDDTKLDEIQLANQNLEEKETLIRRSERKLQDEDKYSSPPLRLDPWENQDPFEPKKMTEKPFRRSKTYRIPDCLNEKKNKKRKWAEDQPKQTNDLVLVGEFIAATMFSYKQKIPKVLQESCLPEFEKFCWSRLSERQAKQKEKIKAMETILEQQILESENNQDEDVGIIAEINEGDGVCGNDSDADDDVGPVLNWQDDLFNVDVEPENTDAPANDEPTNRYEQLVQKHIEAFYVGAQKYAQITELSKRIADWEARILPKLQEEETYEPFDIYVYGTKVLNLTSKGKKVQLSKIMAGKAPHEIGRLFLSTLMLANAGNVELSCPSVLDEGMDKAEVTLLRTRQHLEELETYTAPSLVNKDKEN